jgi:hypothetical protein
MSGTARPWPICPRPQRDESVRSWFERVGHEYTMSHALLLGAIEREVSGKKSSSTTLMADRLLERPIQELLTARAQLTDSEKSCLWPPPSDWELKDQAFGVYCPHCCLNDLANNRTPYGRQYWLQSWCTICKAHGSALVLRKPTHIDNNRSRWSHADLKHDREFLAPNRYRDLKVPSHPELRSTLLGYLLYIERTVAAAISGIPPDAWSWGKLAAEEFLMILTDVTTWALTHFEPVRSWSVAEDLTPTEEQEGYGLIGRVRRMSASEYGGSRTMRTLREVSNPRVRAAALWTAHSLLATCHIAATDRPSGRSTQDRQTALLFAAAPAGRHWLAQQQALWPPEYCRERWIICS